MLPARFRLRRSGDFRSAVRHGLRGTRATLVVHVLPAPPGESGERRAGFVVARAVGSAVVRNRVRRRLRHLVGPRLSRLPPGSRLVVRALPRAAGASSAQLAADLDAALDAAARRREPVSP